MKISLGLFAAMLPVATLLACGGRESAPLPPELKVYEVPYGLAPEVRDILRSTLRETDKTPRRGEVSIVPGGQVLVLAQPMIQNGIDDLIRAIQREGPRQAVPTLEFTYWLILGRPTGTVPPLTVAREVRPSLEALDEVLGPMEYVLLERIQLSAKSGTSASTQGAFTSIAQYASVASGKIVADLRINPPTSAEMRTEVNLEPDQIVILAQSGLPRGRDLPDLFSTPRSGDNGASDVLLYVVRASLAN